MRYSIKDLAEISKVTIRTLHHYDQIGILTPSIRTKNGHRYYDTQQLILLHEILFFKETGLSLKKIKTLLEGSSFKKLSILSSQKQKVEQEIDRLQKVCETTDEMIAHYKSKKLSAEEICQQFQYFGNWQREIEALVGKTFGQETVQRGKELSKTMTPVEAGELEKVGLEYMKKITFALESNLPANSPEVQDLIEQNFELSKKYHPMSLETFVEMRKHYKPDSPFYKHFKEFHPRYPDFLYEAIGIFGQRNASHENP